MTWQYLRLFDVKPNDQCKHQSHSWRKLWSATVFAIMIWLAVLRRALITLVMAILNESNRNNINNVLLLRLLSCQHKRASFIANLSGA